PSIREILVPQLDAIDDISGVPVLQLGAGEAVEIKSLAVLLGADPTPHDTPVPVVVISTPKGVLGIEVDQLLGLREIVIKTLGSLRLFQGSCYSAATIDPEGRVVLVVDVASLFGGPERLQMSPVAALRETLQLGAGETALAAAKAAAESSVVVL